MRLNSDTKTVHHNGWSLCYQYRNVTYTDTRFHQYPITSEFLFRKNEKRIIVHLYYLQEDRSVSISDSEIELIAEHIRAAMEWLGWQVEIRFCGRTEFANRTTGPSLSDTQDEGRPHYRSFTFRKHPSEYLLTEDGFCLAPTGLIIRPDGSVINPMNVMMGGLGTMISTEDIVIPQKDLQNAPPLVRPSIRILWDWVSNWARGFRRKPDIRVDLTLAQKHTLDQMKGENRSESEFHADGWSVEVGWDFVKYRDTSGEPYYWETSRDGSDGGTSVTIFIETCHTDPTFTTPCWLGDRKKDEVLDRIVLALTNCGRFVFMTCQ